LRVLELASAPGASKPGESKVEWQRRWLVRPHWHTVAYGPQKSLRRLQWYDQYVKGPEHLPLDTRPTVWRT
jgi:hypothetical protein